MRHSIAIPTPMGTLTGSISYRSDPATGDVVAAIQIDAAPLPLKTFLPMANLHQIALPADHVDRHLEDIAMARGYRLVPRATL